MVSPRKLLCDRINVTEPEIEWGCAAVGRAGNVSIDVDEAVSGPERWELSIDFSRFSLRFAIPAPSMVAQFRDFLASHLNQPTSGNLALGTLGDSIVSIIKDDEFGDRFFLCVSACNGAVRYTLTGGEVPDFIGALTQANSDIDDE